MNTEKKYLNPLLERAEIYGNISLEIVKLKSLEKVAETSSLLIVYFLLMIPIILFVFSVTIGLAIWIGSLLGEIYYGFFVTAGMYALMGIILFFTHLKIKLSIKDAIIKQIFN